MDTQRLPQSVWHGLAGIGRVDGAAKVTGRAQYTADLRLPGLLYGAVVRSPFPHARILAVHTERAAALPGVRAVLTGADIPYGPYGRWVRDIPALARGEARFAGERVAAVAADTPDVAAAAAALVTVDYEELPAMVDPEQALDPLAVPVHPQPWRYHNAVVTAADPPNLQSRVIYSGGGDVALALAASHRVFTHTFRAQLRHQGYLENHACIARVSPAGVEVWAPNKGPYMLRGQLADWLGIPAERVQIHPVPIGGDFGGKGSPMDIPLCIALAERTGRPVQMRMRYAEELTAAAPRHPAVVTVRLGVDAGQRITVMDLRALFDGGAYAGYKPVGNVNLVILEEAGNSYRIPAIRLESTIVYTHTVPKGHMRAPGGVQAFFAVESMIDLVARELGADPVAFRTQNLLRTGDRGPLGHEWIEVRMQETLDAALAALAEPAGAVAESGAVGAAEARGAAEVAGRRSPPGDWACGVGVAVNHRGTHGGQTEVALQPQADGGLVVWVPFPDQGAGQHTVARNVAARVLGLPLAAVQVQQDEPHRLAFDTGVSGSRVTVDAGEAVSLACRRLMERLRAECGLLAEPTAVEMQRALARFAAVCGGERLRMWLDQGDALHYGPNKIPNVTSACAQIALVRVDRATGQVVVDDLITAVDVASIVNPGAHAAQEEGGIVTGFADAVLEELVSDGGRVITGNLGEYKLPTVQDLPRLRVVHVPGGRGIGEQNIKAIGELTHVGVVPAIANAVADAVGVRIDSLPITAEKVFAALRAAGAAIGRRFETQTSFQRSTEGVQHDAWIPKEQGSDPMCRGCSGAGPDGLRR